MCRVCQVLLVFITIISSTAVFGETVIPGGTVSGVWLTADSPFLIDGDISIHADSALMIQPGVEVNFQGHYHFAVDGALVAAGTVGDSILFTAAETDTGWKGIRINEGIDSTRLEYCNIEYSHRTGFTPDDLGGGISCRSLDAVISHCRISNNRAEHGAGMYVRIDQLLGTFTISDCVFIDNNAGFAGGGFYFAGPALVMTDCLFESNRSDGDGGGGGLYCFGWVQSSVDISGCGFFQNYAKFSGGGALIEHVQNGSGVNITGCEFVCNTAYNGNGAGLALHSTEEDVVANCTFCKNFCYGEGYQCSGGGGILNDCGDLVLLTSVFDHNWAACGGSALSSEGSVYDVTTIDSCTFARNFDWGQYNPGAIKLDCNAAIANTIVSGNYHTGGLYSPGINFISGTHSIEYCNFANNSGGSSGYDFIGVGIPADAGELSEINANGDSCDIYGNIFLDPLLCDTACLTWNAADGDYHIADVSPCLGAGESGGNIGALGIGCIITDVPNQPRSLPNEFSLQQNHPNPFNPSTAIEFNLKRRSHVSFSIFNMLGQRVAELIDAEYPAGSHQVIWDGMASNGKRASTGVYFYRLVAGDDIDSKKMIMLK